MKKKAFTLAEVLITIMILGIIAVITIPTLMNNVTTYVDNKADSVFQRRLGEALKVMNLHGNLAGFSTTDAFVEELGRNLRINKVCDSSHLTDCFTEQIKIGEGDEAQVVKVKNLTTAKKLNKDLNYGNTDVIGVRFDSGVSALIAYNLFADSDAYNNNFIKFTNSTGDVKGNVSLSTDALAILYDLDGNDGDGQYSKDVRGINISLNLLSGTCTGTIRTIDGTKYCDLGTNYSAYGTYGDASPNNWLGAQKACEQAGGSLMDINTLGNLQGHDGAPTSGYYWSSSENSSTTAWSWTFSNGHKNDSYKDNKNSVLCKGDY